MVSRAWIMACTVVLSACIGASGIAQVKVMQSGTTYTKAAGDDGDLLFGLWFPASRFVAQGGTITDRLTGLVWLQDSQCLKPSSKWSEAFARITELNAGTLTSCQGYTAGQHHDWRVPGLNELATLVHFGHRGPGNNGLGMYGFNAQSPNYWSSTSDHNDPTRAWTWRSSDNQLLASQLKEQGNSSFGVLAVRGPVITSPVVPIQSGQTLCYGPAFTSTACSGTGQDGELQLGADIDLQNRYSVTTLAIQNSAVIADALTGLTWLVSTVCMPAATWSEALTTIASLNAGTHPTCQLALEPSSPWRLPNVRELRTLMHYGQKSALGAPFPNSISSDLTQSYWSSTVSKVGDVERHYYLDFLDGGLVMTTDASQLYKVIAVRGGIQQSLSVTPLAHNFGALTVGQTSGSFSFTVKSTGPTPLTLGQIRLTAGTTHYSISLDTCSLVTPNDATCQISVVFHPKATGALSGTLEITDLVTVSLSGTGVGPTLSVSGEPFFWLLSDPLVTRTITVTAGGTGQLAISGLTLAGTNPSDFQIDSENCTTGGLNPGQSCTITVSFLPSAGGERTAELQIVSNAPDSPTTAISLVTIDMAPFIQIDPAGADFGKQNLGVAMTRTLTVSNKGTSGPLKLSSATIGGPASADYEVTGGTCKSADLAVDESCTVIVSFTPSVASRRQATLTLSSNDPARPMVEVALDGIGIDPTVEPEPDTDDGDQTVDPDQQSADTDSDAIEDQSDPDQSDLDQSDPDLSDSGTLDALGDSEPADDLGDSQLGNDQTGDDALQSVDLADAPTPNDDASASDQNGGSDAIDLGGPGTDSGGTVILRRGGGGCSQPVGPPDAAPALMLLILFSLVAYRRLQR
ncbi:MAG: choice-of-anchor D domain-containing protein [Myxococcales bacterium]|nr:choice-of-anchor D domain-containing protein [Myxococcales bacterium]